MTVYIFHRAEGFYPISLPNDTEAIANAHCNPGTIKVTDAENRVVFDSTPGSFLASLEQHAKDQGHD